MAVPVSTRRDAHVPGALRRPLAWAVLLVALGGCADGVGDSDGAERRSATEGCLFWTTGCTRLDDPAPAAPLDVEERARFPATPPRAAGLPVTAPLPAEDLGRVRARHAPRSTDSAAEAAFEARFAGERTAPAAETVYPLPADCIAPPAALMRNSPADRFAPGRNSAAAGTYARAYDRCGRPGTWPRP